MRRIHQREPARQLPQQRVTFDGLQLARQLLHHLLKHLRIKDAAALAEAAQAETLDPQPPAHLG